MSGQRASTSERLRGAHTPDPTCSRAALSRPSATSPRSAVQPACTLTQPARAARPMLRAWEDSSSDLRLSFLGKSEKREGLTCGLVIMCRMCASRCRGLRCCASHGRSVHHTRAGCQGFGAFNTALTSLRKKRKELGGGFSEVTVEWVDCVDKR